MWRGPAALAAISSKIDGDEAASAAALTTIASTMAALSAWASARRLMWPGVGADAGRSRPQTR